jgi:two-component system, NarL family, nitrate/nitrite response regulator NarL
MSNVIAIGLIVPNEIIREGICHVLKDRDFSVDVSVSSLSDIPKDAAAGLEIVVVSLDSSKDVAETCSALTLSCPNSRYVLTGTDFRIEDIILAFESGVHGIILSGSSCDQFAGSLRLVALGERVLPGKVADYLVGNRPSEAPKTADQAEAASGLSHREIDILRHLVNGDANKVIARRLNIAEATVKVHVKTILRKLQLANRTQAAIWATRNQVSAHVLRPNGQITYPAAGSRAMF